MLPHSCLRSFTLLVHLLEFTFLLLASDHFSLEDPRVLRAFPGPKGPHGVRRGTKHDKRGLDDN